MIKYALFMVIVFLSLRCDNESPDMFRNEIISEDAQEQLLHAVTNKTRYSLYEAIYITLSNGSDSVIYFPTCARQISYYLQKNVKGSWEDTGANGIPCIGFNSYGKITVLQGRSYRYTDAIVHFGTYRIRYPVTMGRGKSFYLFTNEFTVEGN